MKTRCMRYVDNNIYYDVSYQELCTVYDMFVAMDDAQFMDNLVDALHFAVLVCYYKEIKTEFCLNDEGIIHQLVHCLQDKQEVPIKEIRKEFKTMLKLVK